MKSLMPGKRKQEKTGLAAIMLDTLRNNAEKSTAKLKDVHNEKNTHIFKEVQALREKIPEMPKMKFGFVNAALHIGKILFTLLGLI